MTKLDKIRKALEAPERFPLDMVLSRPEVAALLACIEAADALDKLAVTPGLHYNELQGAVAAYRAARAALEKT